MGLLLMDKVFVMMAVFIIWRWRRHVQDVARSYGYSLPPGPPKKFLIGNSLDIPRERAWHQYLEWKHKYGDIVHVEAFGSDIIILNSIDSANDLLEKRANNYSDRPVLMMIGKLMGLDRTFPMLQIGPVWKQQRRLAGVSLNTEAVKKYHAVQEDIVSMYLLSLIEKPKDFMSQLRLAAGRIIMSVTYGLPVDTPDDLYISEAEVTMALIGKSIIPGAFLVDLMPSLAYLPSWLPFNKIHKIAAAGRSQIESTVSRPFEHVKREVGNGMAPPSITLDCLESVDPETTGALKDEAENNIRWAVGAMYGAGGETTYTTILSFILAMANYPKVQEKVKDEIDRVVGNGRFPAIQDRPNLPYINATIKESLRWRPALPLGIARKSRTADVYRGYHIPAQSIIMPNVWAIAHDEKSGLPPGEFCPERFLSDYVQETALDPYLYAFGFGRRTCPGKSLGDNNLFLFVTGMMATVNIINPKPAKIDPEFTATLVSHPEPFEVIITPRSTEVIEMIKERVSHIG